MELGSCLSEKKDSNKAMRINPSHVSKQKVNLRSGSTSSLRANVAACHKLKFLYNRNSVSLILESKVQIQVFPRLHSC